MGVDKTTGYNYLYKPNHPNSKKNGMIAEHTYLLSKKINRPLRKKEQCHHKDGNKLNNDIKNLELITISEHTHRHKGYKRVINCAICNKKTTNMKYCSWKCKNLGERKIIRPPKEELIKLVKKYGYVGVGKKYGVSNNSIKKWLKNYK